MKNYYFDAPDIIVFPVIDWYYRFQRPQQISTQLAFHGHRVLYLRTYFSQGTTPLYEPIQDDIPVLDVQLGLLSPKNVVADQLDEESKVVLLEQFDALRHELDISKAVCLVDLPFWGPLVLELKELYHWKIIYHSMDQLSGFSNVSSFMLEPEREIIQKSDCVLATSHLLFEEKSQQNPNCLLVPNGTDFDHFNYVPEEIPDELSELRKPIVGYYGAMSDWLDTDLIYQLASARPQWNFLLIGRLEGADVARIQELSNVLLLGEKPYELLPAYLHQFDCCIIPFKKVPLTEATNPVKLFEFLSAGKSVVATSLDELHYYRDYVRLASCLSEWLESIELALHDDDPVEKERRVRFARQNTWEERILSIQDAIQRISRDETFSSAPLPPGLQKTDFVSGRLLIQHEGADYWHILYEKDGYVYKQTSFDLAAREARFLSRLESEYFPKFTDVHSTEGYSTIRFENVDRHTLSEALPRIASSVSALHSFIQHGLELMMHLQEQGITHRNISRDTMQVQDGKPVLLDFSWAVSDGEPYFAPAGLGGYERPPDGRFSDVYSMGKIFQYVNRQHYRAFDQVIALMTMRDPSLRITDIETLKVLFDSALAVTLAGNHTV
jgi:glycosyltransferase involved in cell wall biosynthesis